jgi:ribosome-associated protein
MGLLAKDMTESKENFDDTPALSSKSQRRREALETRSLAAKLISISPARLAQVPLDGQLRAAIDEARQIRSRVARKRQMQFVAKLLRRIDQEPITLAIEAFDMDARQLAARQHRSEAWRDHLLDAGDAAVGELAEQRRDADAQTIRQLIRNARREAERNKPPAAARRLFRVLRAMDEAEPLPHIPAQ